MEQEYSDKDQILLDSLNAIIHSSTNDSIKSATYYRIGVFHYYKNEYDEAIAGWSEYVGIEQRLGNKPKIAAGLNNIGLLYQQQGIIPKALDFFERSLKIKKEQDDKQGMANSLNNIGTIYKRQGEFKKSLAYYQQSLEIREELGNSADIAASFNNIGNIYSNLGEIKKALDLLQRGLKMMEDQESKIGISICLNSMAIIYHDQGAIERALECHHRSLKIAEKIANKEMIATNMYNIGMLYDDLGETELTLEYYHHSLQIREELGNKQGIAESLNSLGVAYNMQGKFDLAIDYYFRSLKIEEEVGNKSNATMILNNIGSLYYDLGDTIKALYYNHRCLKIAKELGNKEDIASYLTNVGTIYMDRGTLQQAEKYGKKSLRLSHELGFPDKVDEASKLMYRIYSKKRNYQAALKMYELHIQMRDSINNETTQKAAIKLNMQYEYEKQHLADSLETSKELALKDIEISKQQAEAKAERTTKYGLYGGLSLVLIIALVLYRSVQQKKKANDEITVQKQEVEHKNKEILDSITYAERIQSAILPPMSLMKEKLRDGFVLYKPKDIVAGDFYWLETCRCEGDDDVYFSAADCTGHGVPGAMMSVMCSNALTKSVKELGLTKPGDILDATTKIIEGRFERSEQLVLDGMDLALCKLNLKNLQFEYAGANNPLWIVRSGEVLETKADKQPIGMYDNRMPYTNHKIELQKGDLIYIFSDGYIDQFGGPKGKKFKSKPFKKLLLGIENESMNKQKELIDMAFENWKRDVEQVDDVCIIGVKI